MKQYHTATLANGLRVIFLPSKSQVVYCGFQIAAGTRHEQPGEEGLAHFCEHTTFKGTAKRTSMQILNNLERVGGDLNAFTNKEDTVYYAAIMKDYLPRAIDLLCDIVFHSTYPQHEIDKEIDVICDEIESYNDSPAELIYDEFENILFEGHPLGHNILGTEERLRTYTTDNALSFTRRHYHPDNAIFFAYGDIDFEKTVRLLESRLATVHTERYGHQADPTSTLPLAPLQAQTVIRHKSTHQAHVMIGSRAYDFHHEKRIALYLLNNILGGPAMSARLSIALRERNALVYTVESSMASYSDTGAWCTYFGCDQKDVRRCLRLVGHELDKVMQKPLSPRQLSAAKQQIKGQIAIACDNRENFALDFGKSFLHNGKEKDINQLFAQIDEISPAQLQEVAQEIFDPQHLITLEFL
ncbi:MAG: insulinase family protein [Prevotella sp.]|nr:insulinase family protein [Prevotella sp.]